MADEFSSTSVSSGVASSGSKMWLWVVIGVVVVLVVGGIVLAVSHSGRSNSYNICNGTNCSGGSNGYVPSNGANNGEGNSGLTGGSSSSSAANWSCSNIFPLDVLQAAFPTLTFTTSGSGLDNINAYGGFGCDYSATLSGGGFCMATVAGNSATSRFLDSKYNSGVNVAKGTYSAAAMDNGGSIPYACTNGSIGLQSTECTSTTAQPDPDSSTLANLDEGVYESTNNSYVYSVSLMCNGANTQQTMEQMAQEINSKLSQ